MATIVGERDWIALLAIATGVGFFHRFERVAVLLEFVRLGLRVWLGHVLSFGTLQGVRGLRRLARGMVLVVLWCEQRGD
jgi:hypothetical protein